MKRVLIITYYWPPSGGAGVQRWLKFSKYLPHLGWEPVILTVEPEYSTYPALDKSLESEIPQNLQVFRTRAIDWFRLYSRDKSVVPSSGFAKNDDNSFTRKISRFIRGNFFIPDPRRGWNRYAFKKASELIIKEDIKHVITTSPPHSSQLIGLKLKKEFPGLKWIADLRDPWTDIYFYNRFYPTLFSKKIDLYYEKEVLKRADKIITVSRSLKSAFASKMQIIENKISVVTNGFDESDFDDIESVVPEKLTITYVGTLSEAYPVSGLVAALKNLLNEKTDFIIRFAGNFSEKIKKQILDKIPVPNVEFHPYMIHGDAVKFMMSSSVLLLIIPDHPDNRAILTGKLFEYLATRKPILCLGPSNGDAAEIISATGAGITTGYSEIKEISDFLRTPALFSSGHDRIQLKEYSRFSLTGQVVALLENLT